MLLYIEVHSRTSDKGHHEPLYKGQSRHTIVLYTLYKTSERLDKVAGPLHSEVSLYRMAAVPEQNNNNKKNNKTEDEIK